MIKGRGHVALPPICLVLIGAGLTQADDLLLAVLGIATFFVGSILAVVAIFPLDRVKPPP